MTDEILRRLWDAALSGCIAISLVYLVCRAAPRLPGTIRFWLWWLVCLKLVLGLIVVPPLAIGALPPVAGQLLPLRTSVAVTERSPVPAPSGTATIAIASPPPSESPAQIVSGETPAPKWRFPDAIIAIWLLGIGLGIGVQCMALVQLRRLATGAERLQASVMEAAARCAGLRRTPTLWVSPLPIEPLTVGGWNPIVLVSGQDLDRLSESERLPVLAHECVHIRRGDLFLSLVPWLAQTLFWFLPPVYLALREFQLAREAACDQQTLAVLTLAPRAYGELLVKLSSPASPLTVPSSAMALSAGFNDLKRRIEMLESKPSRRRVLIAASLFAAGLIVPWRLTVAAPPTHPEILPNLDFAAGLKYWCKMANGSDTTPHPFYRVGVSDKVRLNGKSTGYVQSETPSLYPDDGGVLRYDLDDVTRYRGKRLRWSGSVLGKGITKQAFLFVAAELPGKLDFATSPHILPEAKDWQRVECVIDVPDTCNSLSLGLRLEGEGTAYAGDFHLEIVDKTVPLTAVRTISETEDLEPPQNLTFSAGLEGWWNDNPTHTADADYAMGVEKRGGNDGGPAAYLKNKVAKPRSYGTIAQNASAKDYQGKRIRLIAYLKSENADEGELWIVVHDKDPQHSSGANGDSTGKVIRGTKGWTRFEHVLDIPATTESISFGISAEGKGTVWVSGMTIDVLPSGH